MRRENVHISVETRQTLDTMLHQILNQALVAIQAEAGSLMLLDQKRGILQIKARLGKPRPARKTEPVYRTDQRGIASWVVQNRESYICNDVDDDEIFSPSFSGKNFRSVLSVPVLAKEKVLAVINADAAEPGYFTEEHQKTLEDIARQVAVPIADRIGILDALSQVGVDVSSLPGEEGVEGVLQDIANLTMRSLGADVVTLYEYIEEKDEFPVAGKGPFIAGTLVDAKYMDRKIFPGDVPWTVVKERRPGFYPDADKQGFLTEPVRRPGEESRKRFVHRERIKSMAALLLPCRAAELEKEKVVGAMFVSYRSHHEFGIDEMKALSTFADLAATAIQNARRAEQRVLERMNRIMKSINELADALTGSGTLSEKLSEVVRELRRITEADGTSIWLREGNFLWCVAGKGHYEGMERGKEGEAKYDMRDDKGLTVWIARWGETINIKTNEELVRNPHHQGKYDDKSYPDRDKPDGPRCESFLGTPLKVGEDIIGVMKADNRKGAKGKPGYFSPEEERLFKILAALTAIVIRNDQIQEQEIEARHQMAAVVVHNLNNPATAVRNALENISTALERPQLPRDRINRSLRNALSQVDDILSTRSKFLLLLKTHHEEDLERVEIREFVSGITAKLNVADSVAACKIKIPEGCVHIEAPRVALGTALTSVIENALEATRGNDQHEVLLRLVLLPSLHKTGEGVGSLRKAAFEVIDNGKGVSSEIKDHLFELGVTTKALGYGLGLFASRKIMRSVGGDVSYDASYGSGTRFIITFPYEQREESL